MPLYIVLYKFTEEGRKNIKATVRRATQVERENTRRGFRVVGTWWTTGQYDLVSVVNAPSEAAMMGGLYNIAEAGNVFSETLRAFSPGEMRSALRSAGPSTATARKRPARRRPARKAAGRRRTARKATTRKRPARKAAARKRPARKAAARKRPASKAAARRPATRRAARPAARRRPARRRTVRRRR